MTKAQWEMLLLLKVLRDIEEFLPYLVLVGGWVPLLYSRYLWKIKQEPPLTIDIDFGFKDTVYRGKDTVADRMIKKKYGEHHVEVGWETPFVPIVKIEEKGLQADVEFITSEKTSLQLKNRLIGKEIFVNSLQHFDVLMERTSELNVEGFPVNVPEPVNFVFHKLLTFDDRVEPQKKSKDLFHAYYVLFVSPYKDKLQDAVKELIRTKKAGDQIKTNIAKYFEDTNAKGPLMIANAAIGSSLVNIVSDIQDDAYERIRALL